MSLIVGISSKQGKDGSQAITPMLEAMAYGNSGLISVVIGGFMQKGGKITDLNLSSLSSDKAMGQVSFGDDMKKEPHFDCTHKLSLVYDGELYNYGELRANLKREHTFKTESPREAVVHLLEEHYQGDLISAIKATIKFFDGGYAMAACDGVKIIVVQDPLGIRPLYFAEDENYFAFASQKKALWGAGFQEVKPLRAGMIAISNLRKVKFDQGLSLKSMVTGVEIKSLSQAIECYEEKLYAAVEKRLQDLDKVGLLLSGGVDSCLLAKIVLKIANQKGIKLTCYTAGLADSLDVQYSQDFAKGLGLEHKVNLLDIDRIEAYIPKVIRAVEERDFVQIEAGLGVYAAAEMAAADDIEVIFSGQGPDELWGGYVWYPKVIEKEGYEGFLRKEWEDIERVDIETFARENKMAATLGMEVRFPYADLDVVKIAMRVSPELKIPSPEDNLGKHPHRELAKKVGIPAEYAYRTKDAAQYGTGIHSLLKMIAIKNGVDGELAERIGYDPEKVTTEKLGSSTRYGYRYIEGKSWLVPPYVQLFLDIMAYRNHLLNQKERKVIEALLPKLNLVCD